MYKSRNINADWTGIFFVRYYTNHIIIINTTLLMSHLINLISASLYLKKNKKVTFSVPLILYFSLLVKSNHSHEQKAKGCVFILIRAKSLTRGYFTFVHSFILLTNFFPQLDQEWQIDFIFNAIFCWLVVAVGSSVWRRKLHFWLGQIDFAVDLSLNKGALRAVCMSPYLAQGMLSCIRQDPVLKTGE